MSHGDGDPADGDGDGSGAGSEGGGGSGGDPDDPDAGATPGPTASAPPTYAVPTEGGSDAETAWLRDLAGAGELTPSAVESMLAIHGDRGGRAIEAVSEGRVKQYRDFTVVVGHEDEYVVEAGGCTCKDSAYNLDPDDPDDRCWHVLAAAIAERIGEVDHHEMWYSEVREFL